MATRKNKSGVAKALVGPTEQMIPLAAATAQMLQQKYAVRDQANQAANEMIGVILAEREITGHVQVLGIHVDEAGKASLKVQVQAMPTGPKLED